MTPHGPSKDQAARIDPEDPAELQLGRDDREDGRKDPASSTERAPGCNRGPFGVKGGKGLRRRERSPSGRDGLKGQRGKKGAARFVYRDG